jgi:hypothetical protein
MKPSRFTEEQIIGILREQEAGAKTVDVCRRRCGFVPGPGRPRNLARLADGAARPARPGQGGGADRRGYRARVLACITGRGDPQGGSGTSIRPRPSNGGRVLFRQGGHHTRLICSNTHWYGTRPMARCCASRATRCTPALLKTLETNLRRLLAAPPATHRGNRGIVNRRVPLSPGSLNAHFSRSVLTRPRPEADTGSTEEPTANAAGKYFRFWTEGRQFSGGSKIRIGRMSVALR